MGANHQHLRAFHAIAIEGGVTRAARRLNVSQPTLSQQLKALEARHGVALFDGRSSPMKLTSAGQDLLALTQRLFATAADIDKMLDQTNGLSSGVLRLGSDSPLYSAKVVSVFRQKYPQATVEVRMGNAREVIRWLSDAQIDAALASDPPGDSNYSYEPFYTDELTCAVPADHRLCALAAIPIELLADEVLLLREPTSKTRTFTERALLDAMVEPAAKLELHGRETIREAIALRVGVSVFFSAECPPDPRIHYASLDTGDREYCLRGYLLCQNERRRSPLMRALREVVTMIRDDERVDLTAPLLRIAAVA